MIVSAVERRRRRRVDVFVDGEVVLTLGLDLALQRDIRPGRVLTPAELNGLRAEEARARALESALRLLAYRPRSERELRDRLRRKGAPRPAIDATVARLRELGYLDDAAFARFWTETSQAARPRSRRLLGGELRRRGIGREAVEEATAAIDDEEAAYRAAGRRLRALGGLEYQAFRERLGRYLTQRGFSYDVARRTIDRCWEELHAAEPAPGAE
jgi:regulatory protein